MRSDICYAMSESKSNKAADFFSKYAPAAMEQQQKYGIPASVTLAQMACESSWGGSECSRVHNNYFGVKAHDEYLQPGRYAVYSDDNPNDKFCKYGSVSESMSDHSRILMTERYNACRQYSSTDYEHWIAGIKAAGYATDPKYVSTLKSIIETYNLTQYDYQAVEDARIKGIAIGYARIESQKDKAASVSVTQPLQSISFIQGNWSLPLAENQSYLITSDYGKIRTNEIHKGLDIGVANAPLYATEDNGKVIFAGWDEKGGGNTVKIEYSRPDGTKYQVACLHLSMIGVQVGQIVQAGQQIGITGNTGHSTGPHLDFRVKQGSTDGDMRYIDPKEYLAEIEARKGISTQFCLNGSDVLAERRAGITIENAPQQQEPLVDPNKIDRSQMLFADMNEMTPAQKLAYLIKQDGADGIGSGDLIGELLGAALHGAFLLSAALSGGPTESEHKQETKEVDETQISEENVVRRIRNSVDVSQARQLASMNYEATTVEQQSQSQTQKIS